ncbi:hypothetical protein ACLHDD_02685 [Pantoea sp. NSTU24]|uniref:hypothetical protein n=1 Tax=Pantoea sp. NSTU24 TaxID=3391144 RepID=UPI003CFF4A3B
MIAKYFSVFRYTADGRRSRLTGCTNKVISAAPLAGSKKKMPFFGAYDLAKKKLFCFIALTIRYVNTSSAAIKTAL